MNEAVISQISTLDSLFPNKKWYWSTLNQAILKNKMNIAHYSWHESIFIPTAIWMEIFNKELQPALAGINSEKLMDKNLTAFICSLMVLSSWKNSQGNFLIDDYCLDRMFRHTEASIVSTEHLNNIEEWTIYIPLKDVKFNDKPVYGFYVHKNNLNAYGRNKKADIIIIAFNMGDVAVVKQQSNTKNKKSKTNLIKDIEAMPYAIFSIDKTQSITDAFIDCHGLPLMAITPAAIEQFFAPYFSLINFFGDSQTLIESEIVGPMRPTYKDIKHSLTYDTFNQPVFRYINPSNLRSWHVGLNFGVNYRMALRREKLFPESKAVHLKWKIDPSTMKLKLITPHNKNHQVPENLNKLISDLASDPTFSNFN